MYGNVIRILGSREASRTNVLLIYYIISRKFNPITPTTMQEIHDILTASAFSPNQRIITADTKAVPQADQTAYAMDTSI